MYEIRPKNSPEIFGRQSAMHCVIEMQVRVYQAGHDEFMPAVSYLFGLILQNDVLLLPNRNNIGSSYDNRAISNDSALAIYRHHGSTREDNVCFNRHCEVLSLSLIHISEPTR